METVKKIEGIAIICLGHQQRSYRVKNNENKLVLRLPGVNIRNYNSVMKNRR